ncbi:E3 ubiquitin-protein ligase TRIM56-like isoform X2 [Mytilus edulis]
MSKEFCTLHLEEDLSISAESWCIECQTFLCLQCEKDHKRNRASKRHPIISIVEYKQLPVLILESSNWCDSHNKKYDFFCHFHDTAGCVTCIKDQHKECRDLSPLEDVTKGIKSSATVEKVKNELQNLNDDVIKITSYLDSRLISLQKQKVQMVEEIQCTRKSVNNHLDKIEKRILDDLDTELFKIKSKLEKMLNELKSKKTKLDSLHNDFTKMMEFATDLQTYNALRQIAKITGEESSNIDNLRGKYELKDLHVKVEIVEALRSVEKNITAFGKIIVKTVPFNLQLKSLKELQINVLLPLKPKLISTLNISDVGQCKIHGCLILPQENFLFVDRSNKRILLFSQDGTFKRTVITFVDSPSDVCYIEDDIVAITFPEARLIHLVDTEKNRIKNTLNIKGYGYGIESDGEKLFVRISNQDSFIVLDLEGNILRRIQIPGDCITRFTIIENNIICTNWDTSEILSYDMNGNLLWKYRHDEIRKPIGIAKDTSGNIYLSCQDSDKVVVLSSTDRSSFTFLSNSDGLNKPFSLHIDQQRSLLLVANEKDGKAFVYHIPK